MLYFHTPVKPFYIHKEHSPSSEMTPFHSGTPGNKKESQQVKYALSYSFRVQMPVVSSL